MYIDCICIIGDEQTTTKLSSNIEQMKISMSGFICKIKKIKFKSKQGKD